MPQPPNPPTPHTPARRPAGSGLSADPRPGHPRNALATTFRFHDWAML